MRIESLLRLTPFDLRCIDKAIVYIGTHYADKVSPDDLAIEVSLTKEKLQAGFQQKTNFTLHEYILQVRIEKAKQILIDSNNPVKLIARKTGFKNNSHFSRVFKKLTGQSPVSYRLQYNQ